ncbi:hypothetical protein ACGGAI_35280 [Streptomyces antibioticus]|uniref:hypothetical protein n=1 Tax=Streptomyces antibioticus TaxID=1890 RepID=UPI00371CE590
MTSPLDPDQPCDPAAAAVALAAEAAVFEARSRMLHEAIDALDTRIKAMSETLNRLRSASAARMTESGDYRDTHGSGVDVDATGLDRRERSPSTPCRP